jgi:hypothetical protein
MINKSPATLFEYAEKKSRIKDPPKEYIEDHSPNNPKGEDLRLKTEQWIKDNPKVYELFKKYSRELLAHGKPFGAKLLAERIRYECHFTYDTSFKITNDYTAYVARKLAEDIPELKCVLKFKKTRW